MMAEICRHLAKVSATDPGLAAYFERDAETDQALGGMNEQEYWDAFGYSSRSEIENLRKVHTLAQGIQPEPVAKSYLPYLDHPESV